MNDLPEPFIEPGVDLRDYDRMPLDLVALFNSDTWLRARKQPFVAYALINLWGAAWHQVPAGSLPNDDELLQGYADLDDAQWMLMKQIVLRGFELCSDGRLYHSTVCSIASEAVKGQKTRTRVAKKAANARWAHKKKKNAPSTETGSKIDAQALLDPSSDDAREREGKGREEDTTEKVVVSLDIAREARQAEEARPTPVPLTPYQIASRDWIELGERAYALALCDTSAIPRGFGIARQWWADGVRQNDLSVIPEVLERERIKRRDPQWTGPVDYYTGPVMDAMRSRQGAGELAARIEAAHAAAGARFLAGADSHAAE